MKIIDREWVYRNIDSFRSQRCVVITGAGISCTSGIPDYRSKEGLFSARGKKGFRGSDYFDYRFSMHPETRPEYLRFVALFKEMCDNATPSEAHRGLNYLKTVNRLRVYSQNICGLEERAGLVAERTPKTELVLLHGDMKTLKCTYCGYKIPFTSAECEKFRQGEDIVCTKCLGRRRRESAPKGIMNTTIVHYNQPHPDSYMIGSMSELDKNLTLLIVVGTSMKVYGVKRLARHFLRNLNGVSLFVNLEEPSSEFQKSFQYMWKGDCNDFFRVLREGLETCKRPSRAQRIAASIKTSTKECKQQESLGARSRGRGSAKEEARKSTRASAESTTCGDAQTKAHAAAPGVLVFKAANASECAAEKPSEGARAKTTLVRSEHAIRKNDKECTDNSVSLRTLYLKYLYWAKAISTKHEGKSSGDARTKETRPLVEARSCMLQRDAGENKACIETQNIKMSEIELLVRERISKAADAKLTERTRRSTVCGGAAEKTPASKGWRRFSLASSIGSYFSVKPRKN